MKKSLLIFISLALTITSTGQQRGFVHPGGIHTQEDFDYVKKQINDSDPIVLQAYNALYDWGNSIPDSNPGATEQIIRGSTNNSGNAAYRVKLAYRYAILWKLTGETKFAEAAIKILNGWASTCKSITGDTNAALAAGLQGYQFAQVGELMRDYSGWAKTDFEKFKQWMLDVFYPENARFLYIRNGVNPGGYWSNWGLCNAFSMMSIGILCDDVYIYNMGTSFYKYDVACTNSKCNSNYKTAFIDYNCSPYNTYPIINESSGTYRDNGYTEYLGNLVTKLHSDDRGVDIYGDGTHWLGQMQELGRDQGHCNLSVGLVGGLCATGWSQGDNLWGWMNNRLAAGIEESALFNSNTSSVVPYTTYHYRSDNSSNNYSDYNLTEAASSSQGQYQPIWYRVLAHFEGVMGFSMPYCHKMAEKGTSAYDWDDGVDHLGLTQLMCVRPKIDSSKRPVNIDPYITVNNNETHCSSYNNLTAGNSITLKAVIPDSIVGGIWTWDMGADSTSKNSSINSLTISPQKSNIYRATYAAANGAKSVQMFSICVHGDCFADVIKRYFYVSNSQNTEYDGWKSDVINTVYAGSTTTLSCQAGTNTGTWVYFTKDSQGSQNNINSGTLLLSQDTTIYIEYTNLGGGVTFDSVKFKTIPLGETVQTYKNKVAVGDYYIIRKGTTLYWTNPLTSGSNVCPILDNFKNEDSTQIWTISLDGGYYKLINKADGRYINEKAQFGVNSYLSDWNTYNIYSDSLLNVGFQITQTAVSGSDWSVGNSYLWKWDNNVVALNKSHTNYTNADDLIFTLVPVTTNNITNTKINALSTGMFNLEGQHIANGTRLRPGIYIINSKKVIVK